jgi:hypothetical protein
MKTCKQCLTEKPLEDFPKHKGMADGHLSFCKECTKLKHYAYRKTEGGKLARMKEGRNAKENGKDYERQKRYDKSALGLANIAKYRKINNQTPHGRAKQAGANAVKYAVRVGNLKKLPCEVCGEEKSMAHHSSYAKDMRLIVTWLCDPHHNEIHNPPLSL